MFSETLGIFCWNPFHFILNGSEDMVCWKWTTFLVHAVVVASRRRDTVTTPTDYSYHSRLTITILLRWQCLKFFVWSMTEAKTVACNRARPKSLSLGQVQSRFDFMAKAKSRPAKPNVTIPKLGPQLRPWGQAEAKILEGYGGSRDWRQSQCYGTKVEAEPKPRKLWPRGQASTTFCCLGAETRKLRQRLKFGFEAKPRRL